MRFHHSPSIRAAHPTLVAGVIGARGITADVDVEALVQRHLATALARLDELPISEQPEIQAWRRAFASMGLKPTQYRCASESLLRRLRQEGHLPRIHPLVDLCNSVSASVAIPIAVFDLGRITGDLEVRAADGTERYASFAGEIEHPAPGEVIFADDAGQAHARRWTNRQSAASAIRDTTSDILIVAEALHDGGDDAVRSILATLTEALRDVWRIEPRSAMLTAQEPSFPM